MRNILSLLFILFAISSWAEEVARVVSVSGDAKVGDKPVKAGDSLVAGSIVKTGADSSVKLFLADKSVVDLGSQTSFVVESSVPDVGSSTKLNYGMVRSAIRKKLEKKIKFQMRTQTSVLAVRGTEFIVNSQPTSTGGQKEQVTVTDGQVAAGIGDAAPRLLNPGQQFEVAGQMVGGTMQVARDQVRVVELPPQAVAEITQQATVVDTTFQKTVEVSQDSNSSGSSQGGATLAAAVTSVSQAPTSGSKSEGSAAAFQPVRPAGPSPVGMLNNVDQSKAETKVTTGVNLRVQFQPY